MKIRVVAPATLEEGFTFDVLLNKSPFTVTVPPGGVEEGQEFDIPYDPEEQGGAVGYQDHGGSVDDAAGGRASQEPTEDEEDASVAPTLPIQSSSQEDDEPVPAEPNNEPTTITRQRRRLVASSHKKKGKKSKTASNNEPEEVSNWHHDLCSCCQVVTQATFWMAFCCTPVLVAQLLTRLRLTWKGERVGSSGVSTQHQQDWQFSYNQIVLSLIAVLVFCIFVPIAGLVVLAVYYVVVVVWIGSRLRGYLRSQYRIGSWSHVVGDLLDLLCCPCCSLVQMARQTHNDKEHPGSCCTTNGLLPLDEENALPPDHTIERIAL